MFNSEGLLGATGYLTLYARCRVDRCRYNRVRLYFLDCQLSVTWLLLQIRVYCAVILCRTADQSTQLIITEDLTLQQKGAVNLD
jgi:hypothetical protein